MHAIKKRGPSSNSYFSEYYMNLLKDSIGIKLEVRMHVNNLLEQLKTIIGEYFFLKQNNAYASTRGCESCSTFHEQFRFPMEPSVLFPISYFSCCLKDPFN